MNNIDKKLPQVKKVELEILTVVHDFCMKHNLRYTLAYGTLLGAVRHKGFIPWDDDIDIWMQREDYNRFIELWIKEGIKGYILQTPYNEPEFTQNFTKIRKDNTTYLQSGEESLTYHKGIFVDIFPLDKVASTTLKQKMQNFNSIFMMLFARKYIPPTETILKKIISKIVLLVVPKSKYDLLKNKLEKSIIKKSSDDGGYKYFGTMESLSKSPYSNNMFDNMEVASFEDREFMITSIYDEVLTKFYGDYMKLPPVEERVWTHHPVLIDFERNYELI